MFSTIPRLFCDSVAIAMPLGSDGSHPGQGTTCSRRRNRPVKKIFPSSAPTRIKPGTPGSVIEHHNHEAKRSGPVRLVIYSPCIFTYILIICTSLCRATTLLHPTMKHLYQMFSIIPRLFCDSVAIASPLSSDGSHPGTRHQM